MAQQEDVFKKIVSHAKELEKDKGGMFCILVSAQACGQATLGVLWREERPDKCLMETK